MVVRASKPILTVDRGDFAVIAPSAGGGSGFPWLVVLVTVGVLGTVGAAFSLSTARRSRRNRSSPVAVP